MNRLVSKILWGKQSVKQIVLTILSSVVGVLLCVIIVNTYLNFSDVLSEGADVNNYLVINKPVGFLNKDNVSSTDFNENEIQELINESFINAAAGVESSRFEVSASKPELRLYFEMFFESVPDEFLGDVSNDFAWEEGDEVIPILLSNDFYNLFSFGFSPSKEEIPQLPKSTWKSTVFDITVKGEGKQKTFKGRIVDFSDRINSVLVPQSFLNWGNEYFANVNSIHPSRVMLKVDDATDKNLSEFISRKGYSVNQDQLLSGSGKNKLKMFIAFMLIIALLVVVLTLNVSFLNFRILVSESKEELRMLFNLGYYIGSLSRVLVLGYLVFQLISLAAIYILLPLINLKISSFFDQFGFSSALELHWQAILIPILISVLSVAYLLFYLNRNLRLKVLSD